MRRFLAPSFAALAFAAAILLTTTPPSAPERPEERSGAMEALDFWTRARAYPHPDIPPATYAAGFRAHRALAKRAPRALSALPGWQPIGPDNLAGRMISVAVNPQNPSTVYAGSASGGLWRSRTGGLAGDWTRVETGFPVLGVGAIAIAPSDSNLLYIGTGEVYRYQATAGGLVIRTTRGSYGLGILKSTDGGATWTKSLDWSAAQQRGVQSVKLNPLNPATVWAATTEGIYKSTDAGATWSELIQLFMGEDIIIHPTDTNRVLVSAGNLGVGGGIYRTTDGGTGWQQVNPVGFTGKALIDSPVPSPEVVVASIADSTTGVGSLWRSTDFGTSWTQLANNSIYGVQGWYSHYVTVHPSVPTLLFHASVGAARSTNGGASFVGVGGLYSDNHDFAYDPLHPDTIYSANDDGIYRSTNFGATFAPVNGGLATGQLYNGFSSSQTDSLLALVQSQDHIPGYLYNGSMTWPESATDEAGWTAIHPLDANIMYAVSRNGEGLYRSTNRGVSFQFRSSPSSFGAWNSPVAIAPSSPATVYVAKTKFFRLIEPGSLTVMNGGADIDGNPALSLAVSFTNPDTVYIGTAPYVDRAHLFRTTNGGATWSNVTGSLPDRYPLDLAVDPRDSRMVYAAFGGYGGGHVFRSTNAGGSWTDISGSLPDIPATALLVDPLLPSTIYLGTDLGVYATTDGGASWNAFSDGLPDAVLVADLSLSAPSRTLRIATHGNGAFARKLPTAVPALYSVVPSGGESWEVGTLHAIAWDNFGVGAARVEFSSNNGASWSLIADSATSPLPWTVPPSLTSAARVRVSARTDTTIRAASAGPFTIYLDGNIVPLHAGWNLAALPANPSNHAVSALFPGALGPAFTFTTSYVATDSVHPGDGYWLKYGADAVVAVSGAPILAETIAVHKGWNLVGGPSAAVAVGAVGSTPPGIVISPFYAYDGGYGVADSLRPGRGAWVKTNAAGLLLVGAPGAKSAGAAVASTPGGSGSLAIVSADGNRQELYLLGADAPLPGPDWEAPPVPPPGAFDARFADGAVAARTDAPGVHAVHLRGARYPITVRWDAAALPPGMVLRTAGGDVPLTGAGSAEIARGPLSVVLAPPLPAAFALRQNYPNPFNPTTAVRFDLPRDAAVALVAYDLLGAEVARIADGPMAAGTHVVAWDARALPSGVYIIRLTAGAYTASIKSLLLR